MRQRDVRLVIEEFILHPTFKEKGHFLQIARACAFRGTFGVRETIEYLGV